MGFVSTFVVGVFFERPPLLNKKHNGQNGQNTWVTVGAVIGLRFNICYTGRFVSTAILPVGSCQAALLLFTIFHWVY